jgi:DNA invertase Pin-like site-specific DNA recombinase
MERSPQAGRMNAVGYTRVSTDDQAEHGASLTAQTAAIAAECERRDWKLTHTFTDTFTGGKISRPGLDQALAVIQPGDALIVAKLDRLTRSVADLANLLEQSKTAGWHLVALDFGLDMSTPQGELVANVLMSVAQWERRIIGQRTKDGLAAKKAQGQWVSKAGNVVTQLGRPATITPSVRLLARELHEDGWTTMQIAALFNDMGLPTPRGGQFWRDSSLRSALQ